MHTQNTHSSLSYTHKTKRLLAQDCGTREVWVPSVSGLSGTESRGLNSSPEAGSRLWPALISEVR